MPVARFEAWRAYYADYPFGNLRGDIQAGIVAATVANVNRGKGSQTYSPSDFMPAFGQRPRTPDDLIVQRINSFMQRYH